MAVILTVLKGIGILLLSILGIFLALILLLLFVPLCYQARGSYHDRLTAEVRVTWLFHLLSVRACFDEAFAVRVRAAGILVYPKTEKRRRQKKEAQDAKTAALAEEDRKALPETLPKPEVTKGGPAENREPEKRIGEGRESAEIPGTGTEKEAGSVRLRPFQRIYGRLKELWENIKKKCRDFCRKAEKAEEILSYYKRLLEREDTKRACRLVFQQLSGMLTHILPRKTDVTLVVGTGDPASTGQILAAGGILYPWLQNRVRIIPDFEEKHLEGDFFIKGHITACVLLICALRVVVNKEVRQLIKRLRKKEEA